MYKIVTALMMMILFAGCGPEGSSNATPSDNASPAMAAMQMQIVSISEEEVVLSWNQVKEATHYRLYWKENTDDSYYDTIDVEEISYTHSVFGEHIYAYYVIAMQEEKPISLASETVAVKVAPMPMNLSSDTI